MKIRENIPIAPYTTFKIGGPARFFCSVTSEDELVEAVGFSRDKKIPFLMLGGGSNLLIADNGFDGLVIRNEIMGKKFVENRGVKDAKDFVLVEAGAGEDWESLVAEVVARGLYGMENLSSIPGKVGASPVQNVGAYGVDASNIIQSVRALDTTTMEFVDLSNADCLFSYRDSIFKHEKGHYAISRVTYKLQKDGKVQTSYKGLKNYLSENGITDPSIMEVRDAIVEIRKNKLPDWTKWGTAGSFFKNPIISHEKFQELKVRYPELPGFPESDGRVKVSLGYVLDKICNKKGIVMGNAGTYEKQALVIVTKPGAKAAEVIALARDLMKDVFDHTGIKIDSEVEWAVV